MSKTLTSVLLISAAIAVNVIPGIGNAISAGIFSALGSTATAAAISVYSTYAITTGLTLAGIASAASIAGLGPSIPKPETTETAIKTPRPPRVSAYGGPTKLFGAYALFETATDGTAVDIYAVHDGAIEELIDFYLGDEVIGLTGNTVDEGTDGRYRDGAVKIYWTEGADTETAFSAVTTLIPAWDSSHRGDGVVAMALTAAAVKAKRFQETYPQSQVPVPAMVAKWQLCPDPTDDDPTDEGDWTWTENPVRHLLHYMLVREGVDYATKIGPAIQSWIDAAADCDSNMDLAAGGTEDRYRSCVIHRHTDQHKDVKAAILSTFDGWMMPRADGALTIYSGRYYEPTVSIGSAEIVAYTWDGVGIDDDEAVNEIIVSYVSAEHDYNTVEGEAWRDEADISARGQVLSQPSEVQVPSFPQARRLAKRKMARIMAAARGIVTTNVAGRSVRGQRYIDLHIEEAGTVFYSGPAEIIALTRNISTGGVTFSWIAADPDIDDWDEATEEGDSASESDRVAPPSLTAPTITAVTVIEGPRLQLTVSSPDREDLTWFGHTRVSGATVWGTDLEYSEVSSGTSVTLVTDIVPTGATVEVQVRYQTGDGRFSAWSDAASTDTVFTPAQLFANGEEGGWWDPSDLSSMFQNSNGTTAAAVGQPVGYIADKSGNGNHLIQATAGSRPTLQLSGGRYYLEFDGSADFLAIASMAVTDGSGHHSSAAAIYLDVTTGNQQVLNADVTGTRISQMLQQNAGVPGSTAFNTTPTAFTDTVGSISATTATVLSQVTASAAVEAFKNGIGDGSTAITGTMKSGSVRVRMGCGATASDTNLMDGRIYGAVHVGRGLTSTERAKLEAYLATKAGIAL